MDTLVRPSGDLRTHVSDMSERQALATLAWIADHPDDPTTPDRDALTALIADLSFTTPPATTIDVHATRWAASTGADPAAIANAMTDLVIDLARYAISALQVGGMGTAHAEPLTGSRTLLPGADGRRRRAGDRLDDRAIHLFTDPTLPLAVPVGHDTNPTLAWAAGILLPLPDRAELLHRFLTRVWTSPLPDLTVDALWRTAAVCAADRPGALVTICMLEPTPAVGTALVHHTALAILDHARVAADRAIRQLVQAWADTDADLASLQRAVRTVIADAAPMGDAHVGRLTERLQIVNGVANTERATKLLRQAVKSFVAGVIDDENAAKASNGTEVPARWLCNYVGELSPGQVAAIGRTAGLTVDGKSDRTAERQLADRLTAITGPQLRDVWRHHVTVAVRHDLQDALAACCTTLVTDPTSWDRPFVLAHRDAIRSRRP